MDRDLLDTRIKMKSILYLFLFYDSIILYIQNTIRAPILCYSFVQFNLAFAL